MRRSRSQFAVAVMMLASWGVPAVSLADVLPSGGTLPKAIGVDVSPKGVDFMLGAGLTQVPGSFVVPDSNGSASCVVDTFNYSLYQGNVSNGIALNITSAALTPRDGNYFDLAISGTINGTGTDTAGPGGSTQTNVFSRLEYDGCATSCRMPSHFSVLRFTSAMPFSVTTKLYLSMTVDAQGVPQLTATSPISRNDITLDPTKLDAAGCSAIDVITAIAKYFITDPIKDQIINAVNNTLLPQVEQAFTSAKVDQDVTLAGSTLHISIAPSAMAIDHTGMKLDMSSAISAVHPTNCVPVDPSAGSLLTPGDFPDFGTISPQGMAFDAATGISDDFVNQALFAAWNGGLLCQTLDKIGGNPIDTSLLAVAGLTGALNKLGVPDGSPVLIVIKAYNAPTGTFGGGHDVNVDVKKLELSMFTEVQERTARIVAIDLDATAGVDLAVAGTNLDVSLNLDPSQLTGSVGYDEPIGDAAAASLLNLLPVLAGQLGPQLAGAIPQIDIANLGGVGLTAPEFDVQQGVGGVPNDTLSLYTGLAMAPGGCNAGGGGCGIGNAGGCDVSSARARNAAGALAFLGLVPFAFVVLRRRS